MTDHSSRGASTHGENCSCVRCRGFKPGNSLGLRHGAYSTLHLGKRAAQLAADIRDTAPVYEEADEHVVRLLALTLARVESAAKALDRLDELADGSSPLGPYSSEVGGRLREDLRHWIGTATKLAAELGLTPLSRGRLGVSVAQIRTEQTRQELLAKYGGRG